MAKKKSASPMEDIFNKIQKQFGSDGLFSSEHQFQETVASPSGSLALDDAVGPWGLPLGHVVQFSGPESSGKTLMALMAIREWQAQNPKNWALFIDAEYTFTWSWAEDLGLDIAPNRLQLLKENNAARIWDMLCGVKAKDRNGKVKDQKIGLLDEIIAGGGAQEVGCGIIVLDSLAAIQTPMEEVSEAGKNNIAPLARFLSTEMRKLTPKLANAGVMLIGINQIRVNVGEMFGDPMNNPGGKAWKHACSLMVNFAAIRKKSALIFDEEGTQVGHQIRAKIAKNKIAPPFRQCEFEIEYLRGLIGRHKEIADLAIKYGVIERPSNVSYVFEGETLAKGRDNLYEVVEKDEALQEKLLAGVKEAKAAKRRPADKAALRDADSEEEERE